jgi:hypothetical protein
MKSWYGYPTRMRARNLYHYFAWVEVVEEAGVGVDAAVGAVDAAVDAEIAVAVDAADALDRC